jgi:leader peptidase (prepilin peptidase)/N-methyltransferase
MTPRLWLVTAAGLGAAAGAVGAVVIGDYEGIAVAAVAAFVAALAVATAVDLRERRIPNALTYPGTLLAVVLAGVTAGTSGLIESLVGMVVAGGVMFLVWLVGRGGLGMGDVKLSAFVGAAVGPAMVPTYLVVGSGLGALVGIALLLRGRDRRSTFAYGPYLAAGAAVAIIAGGPLVA